MYKRQALRATFDALTEAGIWRDDKLVAQVTASKVYGVRPVSYTHLRAHETVLDLVCRLLLEKKNN